MSHPNDHLLGKSGQHAAIAEFLRRGYNVALPEVDLGDDFLVLDDGPGGYSRIQVKTSSTKPLKTEWGHQAQFFIPTRQLHTPHQPHLYYILAARLPDPALLDPPSSNLPEHSSPLPSSPHHPLAQRWDFIVIARRTLLAKHRKHRFGILNRERLMLGLTFRRDTVTGHGANLQQYRNHFTRYWPPL